MGEAQAQDDKLEQRGPATGVLTLTFVQEGKEVPVTFTRRPLGFKFPNKAPLAVTAVTAAASLGVKEGMKLKDVSGVLVDETSGKSAKEIFALLKESVATLPGDQS